MSETPWKRTVARWHLLVCLMLLTGLGGLSAEPVIFLRAILNAASFAPPGVPGGSIARGSIFSIFGCGIGPVTPATVPTFPLATTFKDVSIEIIQGSITVNAIPIFVSSGQLNVIMPSDAPLGPVTVPSDVQRGTEQPRDGDGRGKQRGDLHRNGSRHWTGNHSELRLPDGAADQHHDKNRHTGAGGDDVAHRPGSDQRARQHGAAGGDLALRRGDHRRRQGGHEGLLRGPRPALLGRGSVRLPDSRRRPPWLLSSKRRSSWFDRSSKGRVHERVSNRDSL